MPTSTGTTRVELRMRLLSAAVAIPILAAVAWAGGYVMAGVAALAAAVALIEAMRLVQAAGWWPARWAGIAWGVAVVAAAAVDGGWVLWVLGAGGLPAFLAAAYVRRSVDALGSFVMTALPMAYVSLSLACVVLLRDGPAGLQWLALAFGATFGTDTGAYFAGRRLGRHKLAPSVSPGKTWEGSAGGFLSAIVATVAIVAIFGNLTIGYGWALVLGAAIGSLSQVGDLLESKVKRVAGVKDSGTFLPGHGGILDRLDSLLVVFPLVYLASRLSS